LRVIDKEMAWDWLKSLGKYNNKKPARRLVLLNSGAGHGIEPRIRFYNNEITE